MAGLNSIVNVTITKGAQQVTRAGFGVGLILAPSADMTWTDRLRVYTSFTDLSVDIPTGAVNQAAELYFGQSVSPTSLIVGRIDTAATETPVVALQAVQAINDTFYGVILIDHTQADVVAMAAYIETQKKIFLTSSQDPGVITTGTTDVAHALSAAKYSRTAVLYSSTADTVWPEAAWMGRMFPTGVGQATWKFKTLVGVVADNLTGTQITNAQGKNANIYIPVGGVNITAEGITADGEYIDIIRGTDSLVADVSENVYSLLVNSDKVPYTNKGIATVENAIQGTLQDYVGNGFLTPGSTSVTVPDALAVSQADKLARTLNNVTFAAQYAGAIHKVNIQGFLSF